MAKRRVPRQRTVPKEPQPQGPPAGDRTAEVLQRVSEQLIRLEEGQKQLAGEIREIREDVKENKEVQREQAASIQHLAQQAEQSAVENERAHGELKAEMQAGLSALGATVQILVADRSTPARAGTSEGRTKDSPVKTWGEALTFVKTWWPGLVALAAAVYAWFDKKGGGTPTP